MRIQPSFWVLGRYHCWSYAHFLGDLMLTGQGIILEILDWESRQCSGIKTKGKEQKIYTQTLWMRVGFIVSMPFLDPILKEGEIIKVYKVKNS